MMVARERESWQAGIPPAREKEAPLSLSRANPNHRHASCSLLRQANKFGNRWVNRQWSMPTKCVHMLPLPSTVWDLNTLRVASSHIWLCDALLLHIYFIAPGCFYVSYVGHTQQWVGGNRVKIGLKWVIKGLK